MAHIAIKDIRRTQTSIVFRFKTTFDSDFRRGSGDPIRIPSYYFGLSVGIVSVDCPEIVGTLDYIYVEGSNQLEDNRFLTLDFNNFLYLNTAIHVFNIGKFKIVQDSIAETSDDDDDDYDDYDDDDDSEF